MVAASHADVAKMLKALGGEAREGSTETEDREEREEEEREKEAVASCFVSMLPAEREEQGTQGLDAEEASELKVEAEGI